MANNLKERISSLESEKEENTNQSSKLRVSTNLNPKRLRTPSITEFELEVFTEMWILVVFLLTIGPLFLHNSILMRNQTNLNEGP